MSVMAGAWMARELDLDRPPSPAARLVDAGVDDESMQPGVEPIGIAKLREIPPGSDQPLLDRVACELGVPEDEAGRLVQPHDGRAGELGEGVMIASPRPLHEPSLVHGRLGCRLGPGGRASQGMASVVGGTVLRRDQSQRNVRAATMTAPTAQAPRMAKRSPRASVPEPRAAANASARAATGEQAQDGRDAAPAGRRSGRASRRTRAPAGTGRWRHERRLRPQRARDRKPQAGERGRPDDRGHRDGDQGGLRSRVASPAAPPRRGARRPGHARWRAPR